jgi:branched-chain amino acid transport system substrate-binding protein
MRVLSAIRKRVKNENGRTLNGARVASCEEPLRLTRRALFAAATAAVGLSAQAQGQDLLIGHVGPFTGLPSPNSADLVAGVQACFSQVNASNVLRGRRLSLFTLDDQFNGLKFAERFKEAMLRKPLALLSPIGSDALSWMLQGKTLDEADVVVLNAVPGAEAFRKPGHAKLFHIRAGDFAQLAYIAKHCKTVGLRRLLVLRQDLAVGSAAVVGMRESAAAIGGLEISSLEAGHSAAVLKQAAEQAGGANAQAVLVAGTPQFMADALAALRVAGFKRATFALSYLPARLASSVIGLEGARGLAITQALPNPNGVNLPLQREFRAAMLRSGANMNEYTPLHLEGYVTARVLVAGLGTIKGDVTPSILATALHQMGPQDLGGFRVDFSHGNHGSSWVDVGVMSSAGRLIY